MMCDVVVIGGGVSGLATAQALLSSGLSVQVLERQHQPGGNAISERIGGFLMEHGPTTFNASVPEAVAHIDRLGLLQTASDLGPNVRRRYLRDGDHLTGIGTSPLSFLTSRYLSPIARLSLMAEGLRPRRRTGGEETIHAFASRRFGRAFADKVIDPMAAGLFMGDSHKLSINGAFARLAEMEQTHGSITRAILKARKGSEPGRHLYSWPDGIGTIPQILAAHLGDRVKTGVSVLALRKTASGFQIKTNTGLLQARAIVLAVQPHVAAMLLEDIDPTAARAAADITAPPVNVVFFGLRRDQVDHPLDGLGYLGTRDAGRIISGAQFFSTMYQGRAPHGHVAIAAYAGGARNPELAGLGDADLTHAVWAELSRDLGIKGPPVLSRTRRWALGLPQYTLGHADRVARLRTSPKRVPGLYVTGNFLSGVSVANCLSEAGDVASALTAALVPAETGALQSKTG